MTLSPRTKWWALGGVILAIAAAVLVRQTLGKPALAPIHVPIERGDVVTNVEATGTVDAVTTVNVGAQVSGAVTEIRVDFNSPVTQGQVLAVIEDSKFRSAVTQAEADLTAARAAVKIAEAGVESARADLNVARANLVQAEALRRKAMSDFERQQQLYSAQVSAAAERDRLQSEMVGAQATVKSFAAQVEQAQARLGNAQAQLLQARAQEKESTGALNLASTNLSYTVIRSPIDGVVVARNIDAGQTVASRLSAPNLFNIAQDLEKMYVYTKLDVLDVSRIKVGQPATFTVDAFPNMTWQGKVAQVRISPITQMRGQAAPSQLGAATTTTIPGLQQQSGASSAAGAAAGAPAGSSGATGGSGSGSGGAGSGSSGGGSSSAAVAGATAAPGLVHYDALVEFTNRDRRLLPGMTAYVTIPTSAAYNVLRVRKEALRASPSLPEAEKRALLQRAGIPAGKSTLWILEGGGYRPITVETGTTDYLFAEILSGPAREGQVALAGYRPREP